MRVQCALFLRCEFWYGARMAKSSKNRPGARAAIGKPSPSDALEEGTELFERGDYARARVVLREKAEDPSLSEGQKEVARELVRATGFDPGALWVGAACVVLLALVITATVLTQG